MTKLFGPIWLDRGEFPGEPHLPNVVVIDSSTQLPTLTGKRLLSLAPHGGLTAM